jgi:hypothetical protein
MKQQYKFFGFLMLVTGMSFSLSCTKSLVDRDSSKCGGSPTITNVRITAKDSTTTEGKVGNTYAIVGTNLKSLQKLWVNGQAILVNPALCTETHAIFTLPSVTPWRNQPNKLKISNGCGEFETNFSVAQHAPILTTFFPRGGVTGDTVTITGDNFDNTSNVKFGDLDAIIVSVSPTQLKVKIPSGESAKIAITTPGGVVISNDVFGVIYTMYGDALNTGYNGTDGYGRTFDLASTTFAKKGTRSIKVAYNANSFGAIYLKSNSAATALDLNSPNRVSFLRFHVYGETVTGSRKFTIRLNGWGGPNLDFYPVQGQWTEVVVPRTLFPNLEKLETIYFQERDGNGSTLYYDEIVMY